MLNHQHVNILAWVGDTFGRAVKIRDNRNQRRRRLFVYHRKRSKHIWDVSSNAELAWWYISKTSGQRWSSSIFVPAVPTHILVLRWSHLKNPLKVHFTNIAEWDFYLCLFFFCSTLKMKPSWESSFQNGVTFDQLLVSISRILSTVLSVEKVNSPCCTSLYIFHSDESAWGLTHK